MVTIRRYSLSRRLRTFLVCISILTITVMLNSMYLKNPESQSKSPGWSKFRRRPTSFPDYVTALRSRADTSGFIVLALFDDSFFDMAANMYEFSFRRHSIDNFLFVGLGSRACPLFSNMSVPCFTYADDDEASTASTYGTDDFKRKMNIRTRMIIDALNANLTVLHTDVDVAFLNNPIAELKDYMNSAHIAMMWDHKSYNAGFLVVRPTWLTLLVYEKMRFLTVQNPLLDDQVSLQRALREVKASYTTRDLSSETRWSDITWERAIVSLDQQRIVCGIKYFQKSPYSRAEWSPMDVCGNSTKVNRTCADVVHNNWIMTKAAKIYRFREHLMWSYDPDGKYYANPDAKYLTYRDETKGADKKAQLSTLKTALAFGHLLNRTVILNRFRCNRKSPTNECPLSSVLKVAEFDSQFAGRYRESTFLENSRVPIEVRHGLSAIQRCRDKNDTYGWPKNENHRGNAMAPSIRMATDRRLTSGDIVRRFGAFDDRVLVFDSFAGNDCFPSFDDRSDGEQFEIKFKLGVHLR